MTIVYKRKELTNEKRENEKMEGYSNSIINGNDFCYAMSGLKVQAEESIQSEMANVDITIANKEVGYNSFEYNR